ESRALSAALCRGALARSSVRGGQLVLAAVALALAVLLPGLIDQIGVNALGVAPREHVVPAAHAERCQRAAQHDLVEALVLIRAQVAQVRKDSAPELVTARAVAVVEHLSRCDALGGALARRWRGEHRFRKHRRERNGTPIELQRDDPALIV